MHRLTHLTVLSLALFTTTLAGCDTAETDDGGSVLGAWSVQGLFADTYWFVTSENIRTYTYSEADDCWFTSFPLPFFVGEENGVWTYSRQISNVSVLYAISIEGDRLRIEASGTTEGTFFGDSVADTVEDTLPSCTGL